MGGNEWVAIFITVPGPEEGTRIAETLVAERLAACVNQVGGVTSVFRWEGKVQHEKEVLLMAKTSSKLAEKLIERVKKLHSYTVPEVIALPIVRGNSDYLKWIDDSTG